MNSNLFNMFDPMNKIMSTNYLMFLMWMILNNNLWLVKKLNLSNKILIMEKKNKSNFFLFNMIMMVILMLNLMNISPLMYSITNHVSFTLNITLILWMMTMIHSMNNNLNIIFMNFSPNGTSMYLIFIINIIEFNSTMFSIMSISMRLMINMMMGHLIFYMMSLKTMIYIYMMIEMMIIMIQTYIFSMLNMINFNNMN